MSVNYISKLKKKFILSTLFVFAISCNKKLKQLPQNIIFHYQRTNFFFFTLDSLPHFYNYISLPAYCFFFLSVSIFHINYDFIRLILNNFVRKQSCCKNECMQQNNTEIGPILKLLNAKNQCYPENLSV